MKTFSPGLSDSIASVIADPRPCPHCDSSSHIAGGLCVGCLLEAGLDPADDGDSETLSDILAEVNLPDQNWRLGNYEILEEIGRGGMGVIYRARQRHSRRIVAVKRVLSYHSDSRETLARFRREAQAAASLDHPNILPIYEVSESDDGLPFFSMKFAPGGTLQQVGAALRNEPRQCVALVAKITRAVQYAHSRGILHRDLKPGNILLDGRGEPLVSDFGLAKWLDTASDLTRTLTIFGTPGYIAPEQASAVAADLKPTADIYSLGAILFDLLAGRPPFLGAHALSVIRQAAESPAPKLRTLTKLADRDLETICSRCLDRDPKLRYASAHDLAEDLEHWLEGRPIIARPVSPPAKLWRWSRRNPKLAISVAAVVVLSGLGLFAAVTTNRLSSIVRQAEIAQRSVVVTAFEDLDDVSITSHHAKSVTTDFLKSLTDAKAIRASFARPEETGEVDPSRPEDWTKIGKRWESRIVLTGSVRERPGGQRVTLRAIDTATGSTLKIWFYDGATASLLPWLHDIAELLRGSGREPTTSIGGTTNSEARALYEKGKELLFRYNLGDQYRAIDAFRQAVKKDPQFALAYATLASACQLRSVTDADTKWLDESESASAAALRLAPNMSEAYRAYAGHLQHKGHFRASLDPYLTAYELDPSNPRSAAIIGYIHDVLGRPDLAVSWLEKAMRRETRPVYADNLGDAFTALGEYEKAEAAYNAAAIFRPDLPVGPLGLVRLALLRGDFSTARTMCQEVRGRYRDNPQPLAMAALIEFFARDFSNAETLYREAVISNKTGGVDFPGSVRFLSAIAFSQKASAAEHDASEARLKEARLLSEAEVRETPDNPRRLYNLAAECAALDDGHAALTNLQKAIIAGWIDYHCLGFDPRFDSVRGTEAFHELTNDLTNRVKEMRRQKPGRQLAPNPH